MDNLLTDHKQTVQTFQAFGVFGASKPKTL